MYIWSFILNGMQIVKTATKLQFEKELAEYSRKQIKEIRKNVRFTKL